VSVPLIALDCNFSLCFWFSFLFLNVPKSSWNEMNASQLSLLLLCGGFEWKLMVEFLGCLLAGCQRCEDDLEMVWLDWMELEKV
jgi:hypothetical protein